MAKAEIIPSQLQICVERITADIAREYLKTSSGNRKVTTTNTISMIKEFSNDTWIADSGQGVTFDVNGELVDGHTRLKAFINSKLPYLDITVVRGVSSMAKYIFDTGRKRSYSATLAIHGAKNTGRMSVILSLYIQYKDPNLKKFGDIAHVIRNKNNSITNALIVKVYEEEKEYIESYSTFLTKYNRTKCQLPAISPRIITFIGYVLYKQSQDITKIHRLMDTIYLGVGADNKLANYRNSVILIDKKTYLSDDQKIDLLLRMILYITGHTQELQLPKQDSKLLRISAIENIIL